MRDAKLCSVVGRRADDDDVLDGFVIVDKKRIERAGKRTRRGEPRNYGGDATYSSDVTRRTSATVDSPALTLRHPSSLRVRIPCPTAKALS